MKCFPFFTFFKSDLSFIIVWRIPYFYILFGGNKNTKIKNIRSFKCRHFWPFKDYNIKCFIFFIPFRCLHNNKEKDKINNTNARFKVTVCYKLIITLTSLNIGIWCVATNKGKIDYIPSCFVVN